MLKEYSSRSASLEAQDGAETERIRSIERQLREAEQREAAEVLRLRAERDRLAAQHLLLQERALQQTDAAAAATDRLAQTLLVLSSPSLPFSSLFSVHFNLLVITSF